MANATLQTYVTQVQRLVHDASASTFSVSELIDYINEAREDTALDMHCVRVLRTNVSLIPGQEVYSISGAVAGATITSGGSGYSSPPTVTFDAPPAGGTQALGSAIITNGAVTQINMTQWGQGYTSVPNCVLTGSATATSVYFGNAFALLSITNIWNLQRYMLRFRAFSLFQAYMRSWTTTFNAPPGIWTVHPQMLQVYLRPPPDQAYLSEWDMLALPAPLVNLTDNDNDVTPPWNKSVQFRAAAIALMKNQNFQQAEYYEKKYEARIPRYVAGAAGGRRIPNPYNDSFQRMVSR